MSAGADHETPIKYLSVDEMMLKIARMRDAQGICEPETSAEVAEPQVGEPGAFEVPALAARRESPTDSDQNIRRRRAVAAKPLRSLRPACAERIGPRVAARGETQAWRGQTRELDEPGKKSRLGNMLGLYVFNAVTAGAAALILLGIAFHLVSGPTPMLTTASADRNLIAGNDTWKDVPGPEPVAEAATPAPVRKLHKLSPEALEKSVHEALLSNGFPDIGVSASHSGEVYLAGDVYSSEEAGSVVKVARLATHGRVFFLHPDVQPTDEAAFFGAEPEHAPDVWGARIRNVVIGSPAFKAGVRAGDVIREFDQKTIADARDLEKAIAAHKPGSRVSIRIWRSGANRYSIARLIGLRQFASR